ncbi:MAG: hypothetical protein AB9860_03715 [Methanomassiliicoccales archaeon]
MKHVGGNKAAIVAVIITALVVSVAYIASGYLHDQIVPEEEGPVASATLVGIATDGLGGVQEHLPVPVVWTSDGEYDIGVHVVGLRSDSGVMVRFSLTSPGISTGDVEVRFYDAASTSWRYLSFQDQGDVLVTTLGLQGGIAMYEGYDFLHRLLISSNIDGGCEIEAWVEIA